MDSIAMTFHLFREISEGAFSSYLFSALPLIFSTLSLTQFSSMIPSFSGFAPNFILAMNQECCYSNLFECLGA